MPKLNVQQNNQNVIQAFRNALAIGNLKGIIASDGNHNFSTAGSNRNLLDNPWWGSGEVVNQRSVTAKPSSNGAYCIDRWTWNSGTDANNMSLGANGITFTRSASSIWFAQKMANPSALVGKTITGSVMLSDGTIKSGSVVYASVGSTPTLYEDSAVQIYISRVGAFSLTIKTTQTIRAVKLELGSVSTLANDVPPDYYDELGHCKWYFERIKALSGNYAPMGFGYAASATTATIFVPMHAKRGSGYTVSTSGSFRLVNGQTTYSVTAISKYSSVPNNWLILTVTSSGMTAGQPLEFGARGDSAAYIDVNNDL